MRNKYIGLIARKLRQPMSLRWLGNQAVNAAAVPVAALTGRAIGGPLVGGIITTYRCDEDCGYCDMPQRAHAYQKQKWAEMDLKPVILGFSNLGTACISIGGGEPLLRNDIYELVSYACQLGMPVNLTTNGVMLSDQNCESLVRSGLQSIGISVDSMDPVIHDRNRGIKNALSKTLAGIDRLQRAVRRLGRGPAITLQTTLSHRNLDSIPAILEFAERKNLNGVSFLPIHTFEHVDIPLLKDISVFRQDDSATLSSFCGWIDFLIESKKTGKYRIDNSVGYLQKMKGYVRKERIARCFAGYHSLYVDCYGRIYPCYAYVGMSRPVGDLKTYGSLENYWRSARKGELQKTLLNCGDCFASCQMEPNEFYYPFT